MHKVFMHVSTLGCCTAADFCSNIASYLLYLFYSLDQLFTYLVYLRIANTCLVLLLCVISNVVSVPGDACGRFSAFLVEEGHECSFL